MGTNRWWLLLACVAVTAIAVIDSVSDQWVLIELLIVGPLIAAARLTARPTAFVGLYALLLALVSAVPDGVFGTRDHLLECLSVAITSVFAVFAAYVRTARERALAEVSEVAQRAILRSIPPRIGGVAFAARYQSAAREALVGGDFYDVALTPFGLRVIVGDVRGNGLGALQLAAAVLSSFRQTVYGAPNLLTLTAAMDTQLGSEMQQEDFVTAVLAEFAMCEVRLVNCGHHAPLRVGPELQLLAPDHPSPPFGLNPVPTLQRIALEPGERLLWYTDGLAEARARDGRTFPFGEEMRACLTDPRMDRALDRLLALVTEHAGGRPDDDLALVLSEPLAAGEAGPHEEFEEGVRDPWPAHAAASRLTPSATAMTGS